MTPSLRKNRNYVATECTAQTGVNSRKRRNTYINSTNESNFALYEKQSQSYKNQNTEVEKRKTETRWVKKPPWKEISKTVTKRRKRQIETK